MSDWLDVYSKRINRYGHDYQSRIQKERERMFDLYLDKSVYRVLFEYNEKTELGSFEKYKQDNTETLAYLLTHVDLNIPGGTILQIPNKDLVEEPWMVYYLEKIKASGYNRYIMLRMTHFLTWTARDGSEQSSWAYMYGQENNMLKDEIRSRSRMDTIYAENLKLSFFIMPVNSKIQKDNYLIIGEGTDLQEQYRVTGYDRQSTEGVEFVSVDPIYEYDLTPAPERKQTDDPDDFYWLENGLGTNKNNDTETVIESGESDDVGGDG